MFIQWYPGHMTKAMRMMEECVKLVDCGIIVLDARAPFACINQKTVDLFASKPVIYALNKCDLVKEAELNSVLKEFRQQGRRGIAVNALDKRSTAKLIAELPQMLEEKIARDRGKGIFRPIRAMVAGMPNTGKSTFINSLAGEKKAATGDKAGVTKGKQWIKLNDLELLDTPGTMPPNFENQTYAKYLAFLGSINDEILDSEELALELLAALAEKAPDALKEKYGIADANVRPVAMFDAVCRRRGFLLKGGEYDRERGSKAVIDDFRKGRTGKIMFR